VRKELRRWLRRLPRRDAADIGLRHPRPGGSARARRPGGGDERRQDRAGRDARRTSIHRPETAFVYEFMGKREIASTGRIQDGQARVGPLVRFPLPNSRRRARSSRLGLWSVPTTSRCGATPTKPGLPAVIRHVFHRRARHPRRAASAAIPRPRSKADLPHEASRHLLLTAGDRSVAHILRCADFFLGTLGPPTPPPHRRRGAAISASAATSASGAALWADVEPGRAVRP